jgi:hypothetical protein
VIDNSIYKYLGKFITFYVCLLVMLLKQKAKNNSTEEGRSQDDHV